MNPSLLNFVKIWILLMSQKPVLLWWVLLLTRASQFERYFIKSLFLKVWIIGEYAERIDNADELLESFLDGFNDESTQVQLQLLTAIVKLFLKKPNDCQQLVQTVSE